MPSSRSAAPRATADDESLRHFGVTAATAVMVGNMIGTGVFTALGFQAQALHSGAALLSLWAIGGLIALCGALAYAELGTMYPHCGGEYVYLGRAWHPMAGFLGGWVSMTVGFAAPIALAGIAFGRYVSAIVPIPPLAASLVVLGVVAVVHLAGLHAAKRFQLLITGTQFILIAAFITAGLRHAPAAPLHMGLDGAAWREIVSTPFAVSLVYVSYAFTGWNAAGYIAGEITTPQRSIPRAIVMATLVVTVLYVLLNWAFLRTVPLDTLAGRVEVGALSANAMFGRTGTIVMSAIIATVLIATISAMVLGGSRVTYAVMADLPRWRVLGKRAANGVPRNAIVAQVVLILVLLLTNSFEQVMLYAGFTLNLMSLLAVLGMMRLRWTMSSTHRPYRAWGYPVTPLLYVALSLWTLGTLLRERPVESISGLGTLVVGMGVWWLAHRPVAAAVAGDSSR
ncbi:MAG TPA: amino acid permease [Gemmatimonadaceae bacterium]|nr:amino acid permease [Gemmatimonadaceae bacterium]HNV74811.1 amino acid permease [Gemmatimonadaceae bacterium]HPV73459.1 amino acid permease [Gemmatimonadaceae bacterium]